MDRLSKYWMNFNLLMFLGIVLVLPFLPYAKYKNLSGDGENVLSSQSSKFSDIVASKLVRVELAENQNEITLNGALKIVNLSNKAGYFKVIVEEVSGSDQFEEQAVFARSSEQEIYLQPKENAEVRLSVNRTGESAYGEFLLLVLTSL